MTAPEQPSSVPSPRRPRVATVVLAALLLVGIGFLVGRGTAPTAPGGSGAPTRGPEDPGASGPAGDEGSAG